MPERINAEQFHGRYIHREGPSYEVLGLIPVFTSLSTPADYSPVGTALSVEGYEETHEVSGHPLTIMRQKSKIGEYVSLKETQDFASPTEVVVYEQLEKGAYPAGQLWWRSPENFLKHFKKVADTR